jgi:hypothetical protein
VWAQRGWGDEDVYRILVWECLECHQLQDGREENGLNRFRLESPLGTWQAMCDLEAAKNKAFNFSWKRGAV